MELLKRVRRIECCLAVDAAVKGRCSLNKVVEPGLCKWMARFCETDSAAFPAGAPLRLLGGFAGNGRRFRHGSWTSGRFPAGVVRRRLRRPGETPALGGVPSRFGLRNRPEVASGACVHRKLRILACVSVPSVLVAGIAIACQQ